MFRPLIFFILATLYVGELTMRHWLSCNDSILPLATHTLIMLYQLLALNVAVNSYDHALLTLLVSNQFVEIKGCVFKKFEKDNLFQITCADIVERFTLSLMLIVVAFRNLIELSGSEFDFTGGFVMPKSFGWFRGNNVLWTISYVGFLPSRQYSMSHIMISACRNCARVRNDGRLVKACLHNKV